MKKNMNVADRILRTVIALIIAALYVFNLINGTAAIILGIVAIIFLLTGIFGFCPLYFAFKFSTLGKKG